MLTYSYEKRMVQLNMNIFFVVLHIVHQVIFMEIHSHENNDQILFLIYQTSKRFARCSRSVIEIRMYLCQVKLS